MPTRRCGASSRATGSRREGLDVEMPARAARRAGHAAEAPEAELLVEAGRLEGVSVQVEQQAAAPARAALSLLHQPAAQPQPACSRRKPEQLHIALPPVRLQDEPAEHSPLA